LQCAGASLGALQCIIPFAIPSVALATVAVAEE